MAREARACLTNDTEVKALALLDEAARLAGEVDDQRAARAVLRVRARALRNVRGAIRVAIQAAVPPACR